MDKRAVRRGGAVWFVVCAVTVLFKVAGVQETDLPSAVDNLISSLVYGLVTVWVLKRLDRAVERG